MAQTHKFTYYKNVLRKDIEKDIEVPTDDFYYLEHDVYPVMVRPIIKEGKVETLAVLVHSPREIMTFYIKVDDMGRRWFNLCEKGLSNLNFKESRELTVIGRLIRGSHNSIGTIDISRETYEFHREECNIAIFENF